MTQINGFKQIHDFQGTTLQHFRQCTPPNLYLYYHIGFVYLHSSTEKLFDFFPRAILRTEYGGDHKENYKEDWLRKVNADHKQHWISSQPNYF
ncbi:hypothetical protein NPIL_443781 [Nephila pilipes]|uniref:Uncharacterized protein n=1 Tax=Nephila pilipes TaxID=299642 RepID=A0A8X6PSM1_NEPPI|nr:hypothetical protein NPIL_443781 [Nephila pilipes]